MDTSRAAAQAGNAPAGRPPTVTPQAAAVPAAAATGTFSAGLSIDPFDGEEATRPAYLRRFTTMLDSTVLSMVAVFRGTSGQPLAGAEAPTALSQRERDRWTRCRNLHWDLQTYVEAMHQLVGDDNLPDNPAVQRAATALDSALAAVDATAECDNVASMVAAPDRWTPWGAQYTASARRFYAAWYPQVREVQEHNRAFIQALNPTLPAADRIPLPAAIPRTPPYAGSGPR